MRQYIFFIVITLLKFNVCFSSATSQQTILSPPDECINPSPNNCTFYQLCLESNYHCGSEGYPLGFGAYYCTKFLSSLSSFSHTGQQWISNVLLCLQRALIPDAIGAPDAAVGCKELEEKAFSSHPSCYVGAGFCTLPPEDWGGVVEVVGVEGLSALVSITRDVVRIMGMCGEVYEWIVEAEARELEKCAKRDYELLVSRVL